MSAIMKYISIVAMVSLSCSLIDAKWAEHLASRRSVLMRSRTPEQKRQLLFGNEATLDCGTQFNITQPSPTPKIIGGRRAMYGEFPWQVSLQELLLSDGNYHHYCGGTIIGSHWVLTSAHCLPLLEDIIILGAIDLSKGANGSLIANHVKVQIAATFIHPEFIHGILLHDIALIRTVEKLDLTGQKLAIGTACLPDQLDDDYSGNAFFSGFGDTGINMETPFLMAADLPLVSYETCKSFFDKGQWAFSVTRKHLCAGAIGGSIGACYKDKGGPLVQLKGGRATVIGIVSWIKPICDVKSPTVFTRVASYIDWIFDTIEIYDQCNIELAISTT